jgi:hypothetical protein
MSFGKVLPCIVVQDFLLGLFLQRRLSLAEQLGVWGGCLPPLPNVRLTPIVYSINVVETQCFKGGTKGHYKLVKDGE